MEALTTKNKNMQAPSYTFLMGEYVSFLKASIQAMQCPLAKEFYKKRLEQLKSISIEDLPLYQAEQRTLSKEIRELLNKALY